MNGSAPRTCVALRHVEFEHLGTLELLLRQSGFDIRLVDAGRDAMPVAEALEDDLLVVLGGPIGAYDEQHYPFLTEEIRLIEARLRRGRPTLGICLGAQLMARALGASVDLCPVKEIGWSELVLTDRGIQSPLAALQDVEVLHWHGDVFNLPDGASLLAATQACPHQAFALGHYALGLQFHAEVDADEIESWLIGHAVELAMAGKSPEQLRQQSLHHGAALKRASRHLFAEWLADLPVETVQA